MSMRRPSSLCGRIGREAVATITAPRIEIENRMRIIVDQQGGFAVVWRPNDLYLRGHVFVRYTFDIINVKGIHDWVVRSRIIERVKVTGLSIVFEDGHQGWRGRG